MRKFGLPCLLSIFQIKTVIAFSGGSALRCAEGKQGVASLRGGIIDNIGKMASQLRGDGDGDGDGRVLVGRSLFACSSEPSWAALRQEAIATPTGAAIEENKRLWDVGAGPPHTDAKLRLFGTRGEPRVTFYRDTAAWCPYCQKVWMMLEEKQIPYKVEKINMRSYGEKPAWYLAQVPSGLLPAISLDGQFITESLVIMQTLEAGFPEPRRMLPDRHHDSSEFEEAIRMLNLERKLFSSWCQFVFGFGDTGRLGFENTLDEVNAALNSSPGPWFLPSSAPKEEADSGSPDDGFSLVDLTYVPHLERMAASTSYWKGLQLRGNPRWSSINRWFEALEMRATYMATKSDFYTHVQDIPPQYGKGQGIPRASAMKANIDGKDGSWSLPLPPLHPSEGLEPVSHANNPGDASARHEAAYKLAANAEAVGRFACRGAGRGSGWSLLPGRAPLSDPNAIPNLDIFQDVDYCLRAVSWALLKGSVENAQVLLQSEMASNRRDSGRVDAVAKSLSYLRDRVGVPRDMSYPAARQFRSHLNWVICELQD